ncbi:MAG: oligosaccharide flippase family protein [Firmicutes bacterium]|nr:oligosaccharide flippase family protein [Bacillota bacterium]
MINRLLPRGQLFESFVKLMSGTGLAQLIAVFSVPVLARVYSAADFGVLGIYMSTATITGVLVTGRYDSAIPVPESDEDAWGLFMLTLSLISMMALGLLLGLSLWRPPFLTGLRQCVWMVPFGVFMTAGITTSEYWLNRKGQFGWVAKSRLAGAIIIFCVQFLLGINSFRGPGLVIGFFSGTAFTAAINLWKSCKIKPRNEIPNLNELKAIAKKYIRFPQYLLAGQLLNTASNHLPTIIIGNFFGTRVTGWYTLGNRALAMLDLVATAAGQVFYPEAARQYQAKGNCLGLYRKMFGKFFLFSVIVFPVIFLVLPDGFSLILGHKWRAAGELTRWLVPLFFMRFIFSPLSVLFYIGGRQDYYLYRQILLIILVVTSMYAGIKHANITLAVALYSLTYVISYAIDGFISFRLAKGEKI